MAAGNTGLLEELQELVTCPICLEIFQDPRILPCHHTFCMRCLQGVLGRRTALSCPCCKKDTAVPHGADSLPTDFRANSLLDRLKDYCGKSITAPTRKNARPTSTKKIAVNKCPVCELSLDMTNSKKLSCGHHLCMSCVAFLQPVGGAKLHCPMCSLETMITPQTSANPGPSTQHNQTNAAFDDFSQRLLESLTRSVAAQVPSQQQPTSPHTTQPFVRPPVPAQQSYTTRLSRGETQPSHISRSLSVLGQPQMGRQTLDTSPAESRLTFNPRCGDSVVVHPNSITAHRNKRSALDGLVQTSRHLKYNKLFQVQIDHISGTMLIGVTTYPVTQSKLPDSIYQIPNSGTWHMVGCDVWHKEGIERTLIMKYKQDLFKLKQEDRVGVQRRENGDLHFYINGGDLGVAASNVPADVYGVIQLIGRGAQVTITDT